MVFDAIGVALDEAEAAAEEEIDMSGMEGDEVDDEDEVGNLQWVL